MKKGTSSSRNHLRSDHRKSQKPKGRSGCASYAVLLVLLVDSVDAENAKSCWAAAGGTENVTEPARGQEEGEHPLLDQLVLPAAGALGQIRTRSLCTLQVRVSSSHRRAGAPGCWDLLAWQSADRQGQGFHRKGSPPDNLWRWLKGHGFPVLSEHPDLPRLQYD